MLETAQSPSECQVGTETTEIITISNQLNHKELARRTGGILHTTKEGIPWAINYRSGSVILTEPVGDIRLDTPFLELNGQGGTSLNGCAIIIEDQLAMFIRASDYQDMVVGYVFQEGDFSEIKVPANGANAKMLEARKLADEAFARVYV